VQCKKENSACGGGEGGGSQHEFLVKGGGRGATSKWMVQSSFDKTKPPNAFIYRNISLKAVVILLGLKTVPERV
jgi:hypothetical protein